MKVLLLTREQWLQTNTIFKITLTNTLNDLPRKRHVLNNPRDFKHGPQGPSSLKSHILTPCPFLLMFTLRHIKTSSNK